MILYDGCREEELKLLKSRGSMVFSSLTNERKRNGKRLERGRKSRGQPARSVLTSLGGPITAHGRLTT